MTPHKTVPPTLRWPNRRQPELTSCRLGSWWPDWFQQWSQHCDLTISILIFLAENHQQGNIGLHSKFYEVKKTVSTSNETRSWTPNQRRTIADCFIRMICLLVFIKLWVVKARVSWASAPRRAAGAVQTAADRCERSLFTRSTSSAGHLGKTASASWGHPSTPH